jgi:hypothetical protein
MLRVRRFATFDDRRLEDAPNMKRHVVDGSRLTAEREGLLVLPLVRTRIGLGRVLPGARVVQEKFVETCGKLLWIYLRVGAGGDRRRWRDGGNALRCGGRDLRRGRGRVCCSAAAERQRSQQ